MFILSSALMVSADECVFSGIVSQSVDVSDNGDVEVPIDISGNPGITAIKLEVSYDSDILTLKSDGITDKNLLSLTNGILQGMSGSPILQNGKLIGAVTHVFLNDPTRGYGIDIERMMRE